MTKQLAEVVTLDVANDPRDAHVGLDKMLADCEGAVSSLVIVYEAGHKPRFRYYGRTLTRTELLGVFAHLQMDVYSADGAFE